MYTVYMWRTSCLAHTLTHLKFQKLEHFENLSFDGTLHSFFAICEIHSYSKYA